jgi:hypothetical protein
MEYNLESRLSTEEAAKAMNCSVSNLNKSRVFGTGPKYEKIGRLVRYRYGSLLDHMAAQTRGSTSDSGPRPGAKISPTKSTEPQFAS